MSMLPSRRGQEPQSQSRIGVAVRVLSAALGGYALAALTSVALALIYPAPREEAVAAAAMPAYLVYACAILWSFAARSALRAFLGVAVAAASTAALVWWLSQSIAQ